MGIWIYDSGASEAEISKGVDAAMTWFHRNELDQQLVWEGYQADDAGATKWWNDAEFVAFKAAFAGWKEWPEHAAMIFE